jgi:hypothetical protein
MTGLLVIEGDPFVLLADVIGTRLELAPPPSPLALVKLAESVLDADASDEELLAEELAEFVRSSDFRKELGEMCAAYLFGALVLGINKDGGLSLAS